MSGALNLHRGKIIAIFGAVILHAAAFSAVAFAHLGGQPVAFDGAPVISVSIANPPQAQAASSAQPKAQKTETRARQPGASPETESALSAADAFSPISAVAPQQATSPSLPGGGEANAYAQKVWSHLASYRPRSVSGARQARISFKLDQAGAVLSVSLLQSSGSDAFDRACLQAVRRAAPFPAPPSSLDETARVFDVAITTRTH